LEINNHYFTEYEVRKDYPLEKYEKILSNGFSCWFNDEDILYKRVTIVDTEKCREYIKSGFYKIEDNPLSEIVKMALVEERKIKISRFL
jgi:hypothetical protein